MTASKKHGWGATLKPELKSLSKHFKKRNMRNNKADRSLAAIIDHYANSYDDSADAPVTVPKMNPIQTAAGKIVLGASHGNPSFSAQFDIQLLLFYFTVSSGVYTQIANSALDATLKTKLPVMLFGLTDSFAGYSKLKQQYVLQGWTYDNPIFVYGYQPGAGLAFGSIDSHVKAILQMGDMVIPFFATASSVNYAAFAVARCSQVAYNTLLNAMSSERFKTTLLRYVLSDTSAPGLQQYANNIGVFHQTLFGKFTSDFTSPNSFKLPEQQQTGIVDIPLKTKLDQNAAIATFVNYNADASITWSLFVDEVKKLAA